MIVSLAIRDGRGTVRSTHSLDSSKETAIEVLRHVNRPIYPGIIFTGNISAGPNPVLFPAGKKQWSPRKKVLQQFSRKMFTIGSFPTGKYLLGPRQRNWPLFFLASPL